METNGTSPHNVKRYLCSQIIQALSPIHGRRAAVQEWAFSFLKFISNCVFAQVTFI